MAFYHRLRYQVMLLTIVLAVVPLLAASYFMIRQASRGILQEKEWWLFGVARELDAALPAGFDELLAREGLAAADRQAKIRALNRALAGITDEVAAAYPGVGVGYYSLDLDAIITYGPSSQYQDKVGLSIGPDHEGRRVMATGEPRVQIANLVRGDIVNAMIPIERDGRVTGYIWANVFTADVRNQVALMLRPFYIVLLLALLVAVGGAVVLSGNVARKVEMIKEGLVRLEREPSFRFTPLSGEVGEIAGAINRMVDTRQALQEQVSRMERLAAVGELAAGLAHEIRNPLTGISGFAQCLARALPPGEELHQQAEIIVNEVIRIESIIQELLNFARPRDGRVLPVDINQLVEETVVLISPRVQRAGVEIKLSLAPDLPEIYGDSQQLKQVFLNLCLNAVQAMERGGRLTITTRREGSHVQAIFADTGCGIDPGQVEKIFDPFFTTRVKGTGLGLPVSQRIVEKHGGNIRVESRPGEGSAFTVFLPLDFNRPGI
ncbi:hypothetical protein GFC01_17020 [Desulfofundulus thermobenzoicus]|uniref:histidine kinase n=1 Tax=Desulfofundulus thermobenzoicus TaxID=29376 RepID=A0A6N7IWR1_9FIRM|nr:ATP-binding protein [Desulfofundulus thermobenzoicus]MQL53927.1 hypothetical protein [Desulfofundulus thermobenzoicus]